MAGSKTENDSKPLDFEAAMRDLEQIVERLEHGDLPLEESLAAFERGVMLTRSCQTALKEAEQKVEILLKKAGGPQVEDFDPDDTQIARLSGRPYRLTAAARAAGRAESAAPSDIIAIARDGPHFGL